jgi:hypothetical protein
MAKNLARILDSDMPRLPLRKAAEQLRKKGRGRDTVLAHITPREAARLKAEGGSGTINPYTGLPEFEDGFDAPVGADWSTVFSSPTYETTQAPMPYTFQPPATGNTGGFTPQEMAQNAASVQELYNIDVGNQSVSGVAPGQELWSNYFNTPLKAYQDNLTTPATNQNVGLNVDPFAGRPTDAEFAAYNQPAGAASDVAALKGDSNKPGGLYAPPSFEEFQKGVASAEGKAAPATGGFQTPFGTLGTKDLIAALGIGGLGLNYLNAQNQGKSAAAQLKAAYDTAAQQQMQQAQPFMQQGGQQLSQALTGALSPAQQQQLAAGQAAAAQQTASSGGVAAAQAGRSIEDLRQRLLSNQQTMALSLLGAGTPMVNAAIQAQLQGTTLGINTQMQLSQQAGQAATGMLGMLASMYGRSA